MDKRLLEAAGHKITIYFGDDHDTLFYLHDEQRMGEDVASSLDGRVSFAIISGNNWERDFTPWRHKKVFHGGRDFLGGADDYLETLVNEIIPEVESQSFAPKKRGIVGYSLAGLFAYYSVYKTDVFSLMGSVSGSLWYPGMDDFIEKEMPKRIPDRSYFSIGERESATKNPVLAKAQECEILGYKKMQALGSNAFYETNPGGHFDDAPKRIAKAMLYLAGR
jgi:predicted alpha/beta superfamily hydrolase